MTDGDWLKFMGIGAVLGLTSCISPGPLLVLVISETLSHGKKNGIRIALTPLISDLPIIITSMIILSLFTQSLTAIGIISLCGGCFLIFLGIDALKTKEIVTSREYDPMLARQENQL
jgi:threonine/homoserine/homoserine lactone efflux protein